MASLVVMCLPNQTEGGILPLTPPIRVRPQRFGHSMSALWRELSSPDMPPTVSVVTPSYNQARFIGDTIESVRATGYPNIEHIIIDGGSTDGSQEVIEKYADDLAYWVSEPDEGQTHALIKGFERATGEILCWLNSDDLFEPWTLHEVVATFDRRTDLDWVYGDATWIDVNGEVIQPKKEHGFSRFIWMYDHNFVPQPSTFWRADLYRQVGGLDPTFDLAMDADLWIRFAEVSRPGHVRRPWSRMRFYPEQKNTAMRGMSGREGSAIRRRYISPGRLEYRTKRILARSLRAAWKTAAGCYSPRDIARNIRTLATGETWEQREIRR